MKCNIIADTEYVKYETLDTYFWKQLRGNAKLHIYLHNMCSTAVYGDSCIKNTPFLI